MGKIFSFDRDKNGRFLPKENEKIIDGLLTFLSQIQLNQVQQTGKSALHVVVTVKDQKWIGAWDGLSFVWVEGPNKGKGEILSDKKERVFFRGKYIFDDVSLDLCSTRVEEILLQANGKNYDLVTSGKNWVLKNSNEPVDTVSIEKWLSQLCQVKIAAVVDPKYIPLNQTTEALNLRFVDGHQVSLLHAEKNLFLQNGSPDNPGLILEGMVTTLESLKKALLNPAKP